MSKKKGKVEEPDDLGLPADGTLPIRGPEDALRALKEKSLMDRVSTLCVIACGSDHAVLSGPLTSTDSLYAGKTRTSC